MSVGLDAAFRCVPAPPAGTESATFLTPSNTPPVQVVMQVIRVRISWFPFPKPLRPPSLPRPHLHAELYPLRKTSAAVRGQRLRTRPLPPQLGHSGQLDSSRKRRNARRSYGRRGSDGSAGSRRSAAGSSRASPSSRCGRAVCRGALVLGRRGSGAFLGPANAGPVRGGRVDSRRCSLRSLRDGIGGLSSVFAGRNSERGHHKTTVELDKSSGP